MPADSLGRMFNLDNYYCEIMPGKQEERGWR
jgi:hypothetical protein